MITPIHRPLHIPSFTPHPFLCRGEHTENREHSCFTGPFMSTISRASQNHNREHPCANKTFPTSLVCPLQSWMTRRKSSPVQAAPQVSPQESERVGIMLLAGEHQPALQSRKDRNMTMSWHHKLLCRVGETSG